MQMSKNISEIILLQIVAVVCALHRQCCWVLNTTLYGKPFHIDHREWITGDLLVYHMAAHYKHIL
jgi:hypothetical protein